MGLMKIEMGVENVSPYDVPGKFLEASDQNASCIRAGILANFLHYYTPGAWHRT